MPRTLRTAFLWIPLLSALFALGWWRGQHPDFHWRSIFYTADSVVILTPDPEWIPADFLRAISEQTETELRVEQIADFADFEARLVLLDAPGLVWIPAEWARGLSAHGLLLPLGEGRLIERVHADFRSATKDDSYLPVAWAPAEGALRIEGLAVPVNGKDRSTAIAAVLAWTNAENASRQIRAIPAASALSFSDDADLPFDKKAKSLRNRTLIQ